MGTIDKTRPFSKRYETSIQLLEPSSFSVCCCCLELAWKQCAWTPYKWMDQEEIYGEMLEECFGIMLSNKADKRDLICETCITQLRTAMNFKRQVLTCQELLLNNIIELQEKTNLKTVTTVQEYKGVDVDSNDEKCVDDDQMSSYSDVIHSLTNEQHLSTVDDIEEDLEQIKKGTKRKKPSNQSHQNKENTENKELPTKRVTRSTKPCSSNNEIQQENVKSNINNGQANVKIESDKDVSENNDTKKKHKLLGMNHGKRRYNYLKSRLNICLLLENSTLVPFKANKGCFFCFYCIKEFPVFEELKQHMRENHGDITFKDILKQLYRANRVRTDTSDIRCKICLQELDTVGSLVEHLTEKHDLQFSDHARKPVDWIIPYNLRDGKNKCSVCGKEFIFFKMLSKHMNEHTSNYVCTVCGKCFLLPERLQTHRHIHIAEPSVECDRCGKKMLNNFLLRAHIRNVHNRSPYGCIICKLKFRTFSERLSHLDSVHGMKVTNVSCSQCNKTFRFPHSLYTHVRHAHAPRREGRFACEVCARTFSRRHEVTRHMVVHTRRREFECDACHKRYSRRATLAAHRRRHCRPLRAPVVPALMPAPLPAPLPAPPALEERRWSCGRCGAAFPQKCALHYHIKTQHEGADLDTLVVCTRR